MFLQDGDTAAIAEKLDDLQGQSQHLSVPSLVCFTVRTFVTVY